MIAHDPTIVVHPKSADADMKRRAAKLFKRLRESKQLGSLKLVEKAQEWERVYAGVFQAAQLGGALRVPTGNRGMNRGVLRRVVDAAIDMKILQEQPRAGRNVRRQLSPGPNWR